MARTSARDTLPAPGRHGAERHPLYQSCKICESAWGRDGLRFRARCARSTPWYRPADERLSLDVFSGSSLRSSTRRRATPAPSVTIRLRAGSVDVIRTRLARAAASLCITRLSTCRFLHLSAGARITYRRWRSGFAAKLPLFELSIHSRTGHGRISVSAHFSRLQVTSALSLGLHGVASLQVGNVTGE